MDENDSNRWPMHNSKSHHFLYGFQSRDVIPDVPHGIKLLDKVSSYLISLHKAPAWRDSGSGVCLAV